LFVKKWYLHSNITYCVPPNSKDKEHKVLENWDLQNPEAHDMGLLSLQTSLQRTQTTQLICSWQLLLLKTIKTNWCSRLGVCCPITTPSTLVGSIQWIQSGFISPSDDIFALPFRLQVVLICLNRKSRSLRHAHGVFWVGNCHWVTVSYINIYIYMRNKMKIPIYDSINADPNWLCLYRTNKWVVHFRKRILKLRKK
jgi:hypothetical protein